MRANVIYGFRIRSLRAHLAELSDELFLRRARLYAFEHDGLEQSEECTAMFHLSQEYRRRLPKRTQVVERLLRHNLVDELQ